MRKLLLLLFFLSCCYIYHGEIALVTAEGYGSSRGLYLAEDGGKSTGFAFVGRRGGGRSGGGTGGRSSPRLGRSRGASRIPYSGRSGSNGNGGSHHSSGRVWTVISGILFLYAWF